MCLFVCKLASLLIHLLLDVFIYPFTNGLGLGGRTPPKLLKLQAA